MRTRNIRFCTKVGLTQKKNDCCSNALLVNKTTELTERLFSYSVVIKREENIDQKNTDLSMEMKKKIYIFGIEP